jgi:(E)-4-hydroxy-3-methylbut-2-enyl-diphosphate synthase
MCDTDTRDAAATVAQIRALCQAGCDIVRVAVPDTDAAAALAAITESSPIPVVADIHFDYRLAVLSAENGAAKIRINPGNIGSREKVREVVKACAERKIPIRIGVNGGSVNRSLLAKAGLREGMLRSGLEQAAMLTDMGFTDICLSFKASNVPDTVAVNRLAATSPGFCFPLHLGVTETGTNGLVKSAAGIGALLLDGIGDTIRVSLTAPPAEEVKAGIALLKAVGLRKEGVEIVSCPTCARRGIDVIMLAREVEAALSDIKKPLKVAVMGCSVNGPGEARDADLGVAGTPDGGGVLFRNGEALRTLRDPADILPALIREARALAEDS